MRRASNDAEGRTEAFQQVTRRLIGCKEMIERSPWAGLTELTQKNGEDCPDSVSFFLDVPNFLCVSFPPLSIGLKTYFPKD